MFDILLLLHLLGATIWTGGHLVLSLVVLPGVLRRRSVGELLRFESGYEKIGIPALLVQVITGVMLAWRMVPDVTQWFSFNGSVSQLVGIKLVLLLLTAAFAVDARLRIIPQLSENNLVALAWHVIPVTIISVLFVIVGVSFRTGWFY
ncbi:MAG: CopD family protein [Thiohalophilus sp.]